VRNTEADVAVTGRDWSLSTLRVSGEFERAPKGPALLEENMLILLSRRVRDRKLLTEALDITPPFLRNKHTDTGEISPSIFIPESCRLTRSRTHLQVSSSVNRLEQRSLVFWQLTLIPFTDYRNWQISLGRRFRSLKLYFVLRSYVSSALSPLTEPC